MKLCASHGTMANVFALYFYFATLAAIANTQSSSFVARKPVLRGFTGCREITVVDGKKVKKVSAVIIVIISDIFMLSMVLLVLVC